MRICVLRGWFVFSVHESSQISGFSLHWWGCSCDVSALLQALLGNLLGAGRGWGGGGTGIVTVMLKLGDREVKKFQGQEVAGARWLGHELPFCYLSWKKQLFSPLSVDAAGRCFALRNFSFSPACTRIYCWGQAACCCHGCEGSGNYR